MFALIIVLYVVATITAMFVLARVFAGGSKAARIAIWSTTGILAAFILVSMLLSFKLHGPGGRFEPGTVASLIREWIIFPGQFATLLLPIASSVAYFTARPVNTPSYLSIFTLAIASLSVALILALVTGCNYAGACL